MKYRDRLQIRPIHLPSFALPAVQRNGKGIAGVSAAHAQKSIYSSTKIVDNHGNLSLNRVI
jgi:hypothetical protein